MTKVIAIALIGETRVVLYLITHKKKKLFIKLWLKSFSIVINTIILLY